MINFRAMLHDLTGKADKFAVRIEGREEMHALLAAVSPILDRGKQDQWKQQWRSMSLLGSFAMMALLDLTEGRRIHECPVDKRMFVADAWQVRYCSPRCRHTAQKRAYRLKKRRLLRRVRASSHERIPSGQVRTNRKVRVLAGKSDEGADSGHFRRT